MVAAAILACTLALTSGPDSSAPSVPVDPIGFHVRAIDPTAQEGIRAGASGSKTFRALLARLAASDLIVYIEIVDRIIGGSPGRLYFVAATPRVRYVRIELVADGNSREMVGLVGHELQHAVEIADARHVRDSQAMALLYLVMAENTQKLSRYDSVAARVTEERIKSELAGYRAGLPPHPGAQTLTLATPSRIERNHLVAGR
jgi:hypothetical protein